MQLERWLRFCLILTAILIPAAAASAQTTTYHLHNETSGDFCCYALKTSGPDVAAVAIQSGDLKNHASGYETLRLFQIDAAAGAGTIAADSSVPFTLWMKKTANWGVIYPHVALSLNGTTSICSQVGPTAIGTSLTAPLTFSCPINSSVVKTASDQLRLMVGYYIATTPGNHSVKVELDIEGTVNGNYDSRFSVPNPVAPNISSVNPTSGGPGTSVTVTGTNFGATQGTSAVKFNGVTASPTNWSDTSITVPVPALATSGLVTVTVGGAANTCTGPCSTFTVFPSISSLSTPSAAIGELITISGNNFGLTQGSSTVTFNGIVGAPTQWSATSIGVPVPAGASTGPVVVTVGGNASAGAALTVFQPTITSLSVSAGIAGDPVTITGTHFLDTQLSNSGVTFNGVAAAIAIWSDTSIVTTIPAGATTGPVVVTVFGQPSNSQSITVYTTGTVAGTITKTAGGGALQGATVQAVLTGAIQGTAISAADGTYSIATLPPGTYDIRVHATSYSSEVRSSTVVSANATTTVNVALSQPGSISGKVTQADGATPIADAAVSVFLGGIEKGSTQTNGSGDYAIANLHVGAYTVQAVNVGNRTKEQGATILEATNTVSNLLMDPAGTGPVTYAYDDLGRLVQVTDPAGDSAIYRYDAVGNILAIERPGGGSVAISTFTPGSGADGTTVTIYGTGFSPALAQNTVTFGGAAATISSSTTTHIVATVPQNATSGSIGVTTPAGSATSSVPFTVMSGNGAPTISSVAPTSAASGTALTVNGTNFETAAANNNLRLNISPTQVSTATATALQATVPPSATTGHVSVATPKGTAVTPDYLWIAPPPYSVADLESTGVLPFGTNTGVAVATANTIALRVFEGTEGHRVSLNLTGLTGGNATVALYDPFAKVIASALIVSSGFVDTVSVRSTATYSLVFDPSSTAATSGTLMLYDVPADFSAAITIGGSSVTVPITTPGQNGSLTFTGTAGQRISVVGTNGTIAGQILGCDVNVGVLKPDGAVLVAGTCMEGTGFIDAITLPTSGTYRIVVDPVTTAIGNLTLTLHSVTDFTGSITAGGATVTVPITAPGQNGTLTFSGTQDQRVSLEATNGTIFGHILGCDVNVSILNPDNTVLAGATCMEGTGFIDAVMLPATGTYSIVIDPASTAIGNLPLTLYMVSDVSGTITAGGASVPVSIGTPGQNGALTFSGTQGERVSLEGTNGTILGQILGCDVTVSIRNPDNSVLVAPTCMESSGSIGATTLPANGTYTIVIDPVSTATGSLTLTLSNVTDLEPAFASTGVQAPSTIATVLSLLPDRGAGLTSSSLTRSVLPIQTRCAPQPAPSPPILMRHTWAFLETSATRGRQS